MPQLFDDVGECVESTLRRVGNRIVLALPLALGKPVPYVNELYRRALRDPSIQLKIFTALSLRKPRAGSELERRFLEPFVARVFGNYPELEYTRALQSGTLPANIEVIEFFLEPGAWLKSPAAQQHYLSANYTHVVREVLARGVNVLAQLIAQRPHDGGSRYSLSCNPDLTIDLLDQARRTGHTLHTVGQVNRQLPFMFGGAEVGEATFDFLLDHPRYDYDLYCPPNLALNTPEYAIGLHASALVRDGGTLQLGIGELGDAIVYCLLLRHQQNTRWRQVLDDTGARRNFATQIGDTGGLDVFERGLYGCTEMFVDGYLDLYRAGILKRRVYPDINLQQQLNAGEPEAQTQARRRADGAVLHGGFFLGPKGFYAALRDLPERERRAFDMTGVNFINQLYGPDMELRIAQRQHARFINTAMMVTLTGAAVSDTLADGRVVSGVGGQYNFVAMAHALPGARAILAVRSTRTHDGRTTSNLVWSYPNATIPRHLRDIVITEYGIADLRGKTDAETIAALLNVADSRFQEDLMRQAQAAGKLPASHRIPEAHRNNTPASLEKALAAHRQAGFFSEYPFGTDFTAEEIVLAKALRHLQSRTSSLPSKLATVSAAAFKLGTSAALRPYLERMQLDKPRTANEWLQKKLLARALTQILRP